MSLAQAAVQQEEWLLHWWPVVSAIAVPVVGALLSGLVYLLRREVQRTKSELVSEVSKKTAEIQPNKNGGKSLTDANVKIDELKDMVREAVRGMTSMENRLADGQRDIGLRLDGLEASHRDHLASHVRGD